MWTEWSYACIIVYTSIEQNRMALVLELVANRLEDRLNFLLYELFNNGWGAATCMPQFSRCNGCKSILCIQAFLLFPAPHFHILVLISLKDWLIILFENEKQRDKERKRARERIPHLLNYSPYDHKSQEWIRPKQGAWYSIQLSGAQVRRAYATVFLPH